MKLTLSTKRGNFWQRYFAFFIVLFAAISSTSTMPVEAATSSTTYGTDANEYTKGEDGWYFKFNFVNGNTLSNSLTQKDVTGFNELFQANYKNDSAVKQYDKGDLQIRIKTLSAEGLYRTYYFEMNMTSDSNWYGTSSSDSLYVEKSIFSLEQGADVEGAVQMNMTHSYKTYTSDCTYYLPSDCDYSITATLYDTQENKVLCSQQVSLIMKKTKANYSISNYKLEKVTKGSDVSAEPNYKNYIWYKLDVSSNEEGGQWHWYHYNDNYRGYTDEKSPYIGLSNLPSGSKVIGNYTSSSVNENGSAMAQKGYGSIYIGFPKNISSNVTYTCYFGLYGTYHDTDTAVLMDESSFSVTLDTNSTDWNPISLNTYATSSSAPNINNRIFFKDINSGGFTETQTVYMGISPAYDSTDYNIILDTQYISAGRSDNSSAKLTEDEYHIYSLHLYNITDKSGVEHTLVNKLSETDTTEDNVEIWLRKEGSSEYFRYYGSIDNTIYVSNYGWISEVKYIVKNIDYAFTSAKLDIEYCLHTSNVSGSIAFYNKFTLSDNMEQYETSVDGFGGFLIAEYNKAFFPTLNTSELKYSSRSDAYISGISGGLFLDYTQSSQKTFSGFTYNVIIPASYTVNIDSISYTLGDSSFEQLIKKNTTYTVTENFNNDGSTLVHFVCDLTDNPISISSIPVYSGGIYGMSFVYVPFSVEAENIKNIDDYDEKYNRVVSNLAIYTRPFDETNETWYEHTFSYTSGAYSYPFDITRGGINTVSIDYDNIGDTSKVYAYAKVQQKTQLLASSQAATRIKVKTDRTTGYYMSDVNVSPSTDYSYKLLATTSVSDMTDIILYTNLEYSGWKGTILGFDLSELEEQGFTAQIYTSTEVKPDTLENSPDSWKLYTEGDDLSSVESVAMKIVDAETLEPAVVAKDSSIAAYINMHSPERVPNATALSNINCTWSSVDNPGYVGVTGNELAVDMREEGVVQNFYNITTTINNGEITPSSTGLYEFTDHTVTYAAPEKYYVESVKIDGVLLDLSVYPDSYTFENLDSDHTVEVVTKPYVYVTTNIKGGTITGQDGEFKQGESTEFTIIPEDGYYINSITINGLESKIEDVVDLVSMNKDYDIYVECLPLEPVYGSLDSTKPDNETDSTVTDNKNTEEDSNSVSSANTDTAKNDESATEKTEIKVEEKTGKKVQAPTSTAVESSLIPVVVVIAATGILLVIYWKKKHNHE
jgi:hypothetical protein